MTSPKSILGTIGLSVFCLCTFGASSALATSPHECLSVQGQTAVEYSNGTCSTPEVGGGWRTVPISLPAILNVTHTASSSISATIGGIKVKILCEKLSGETEITGEEVGGEKRVHGEEAVFSFSGCKVEEPAGKGCKVAKPIATKPATSLTKEESGEVVKNTFTPEEGTELMTITISGCEGGFMTLNGAKKLTGTLAGLIAPTNPTSSTFSATSGSNLKFAGQTATFVSTTHEATLLGTTIAYESP